MKKITLLLFGLFALITAQAQDLSVLTCSTQEECIIIMDSLLKDAKRAYEFVEFRNPGNENRYYFSFIEANPTDTDNPTKAIAVFAKYMRGANPALEIEGTPVYEINAIRGKFLDLFPIWKKYVDPEADAELLVEKGRSHYDYTMPHLKYYFKQNDNNDKSIWIIQRDIAYKEPQK